MVQDVLIVITQFPHKFSNLDFWQFIFGTKCFLVTYASVKNLAGLCCFYLFLRTLLSLTFIVPEKLCSILLSSFSDHFNAEILGDTCTFFLRDAHFGIKSLSLRIT